MPAFALRSQFSRHYSSYREWNWDQGKRKKKKVGSHSLKTVVMRYFHAFSPLGPISLHLSYNRFSVILSQSSCPELICSCKTYSALKLQSFTPSCVGHFLHSKNITAAAVCHTLLPIHNHKKTAAWLIHQRGKYTVRKSIFHMALWHKGKIWRKQGKQLPLHA